MAGDEDAEEADITGILRRSAAGDAEAQAALYRLLYEDLRCQARRLMRGQPGDHTLQATGLLHEAYIKVVRHRGIDWKSRGHFLAVASRAMRQVLVDHARGKARRKRAAGGRREPLTEQFVRFEESDTDIEALDRALIRLAERDALTASVVELKFFGGLSNPEVARALGISLRSAEREWAFARAWLRAELSP